MPRDPILDNFEEGPPVNKDAWIKMAFEEGITGPTTRIYDEEFNSASKFTVRQFLRLRTLWRPVKPRHFDPTKFGLSKEEINGARIELANYNSWNSYCKSFEPGTKMKEGNFFAAKIHQKNAADIISEIISSPIANRTRSKNLNPRRPDPDPQAESPTRSRNPGGQDPGQIDIDSLMTPGSKYDELDLEPSPLPSGNTPMSKEFIPDEPIYGKTRDEQIVNSALIDYLNALTDHFDLGQHWVLHRRPLHAIVNGKQLYEARTDGYLTDESGQACRGLIEVKAARRDKHMFEIFRQESAQMVAWIISEPDRDPRLPGRCVQELFTLTFKYSELTESKTLSGTTRPKEIFMNFAKYDDGFVEYVNGKGVGINDPNSFNTIFEIGPYNTKERGEMERLGPILLALTKRAARDAAEEEVKAKEEGKEKISRGQHYPDRINLTKRLEEIGLTDK